MLSSARKSSTSNRRRMYRLAVGESKKITVYSAEAKVTVGVMRSGYTAKTHKPMKASKGVEKSCRRKARRKRGQRRGKERSRGRQPRSSSPPSTQPSKRVASNRSIVRCSRMFTYWTKRRQRVVNLVKGWQKFFGSSSSCKWDYGSRIKSDDVMKTIRTVWQEAVDSLQRHRHMGPIIRAQYFCRTFGAFVDSHTGHKKAINDFASLLDELEIGGLMPNDEPEKDRVQLEAFHKRIQHLSGRALRCKKCKTVVTKPWCKKCKIKVVDDGKKNVKVSSGYSTPTNASSLRRANAIRRKP